MKKALWYSWVLVGAACALAANQVDAAQPPDPTASDSLFNTAGGTQSLLNITSSGYNAYNTGFGYRTLYENGIGTASGGGAENSAFGGVALTANTSGSDKTGMGWDTMGGNSTGGWGTAIGAAALRNNTTGNYNAAVGALALSGNTTGTSNIAVGYEAGYNLTTGSNNIDIGNVGVAGESSTMRLGSSSLTGTYIAGVSGVTVTGGGSDVIIGSDGHLGTVASSARYKNDINDMGEDSSRLLDLRPVTFRYKSDPSQEKQYGLVAEEVATVYPDLVVRNQQGQVESVQYHELIPMLVNELQKERKARDQDEAEISELRLALKEQASAIAQIQARAGAPGTVASR